MTTAVEWAEWLKTLWPIAVVLAAFGLRVEVGQKLNKQRLETIDRDILQNRRDTEKAHKAAKDEHDKAMTAIHARVSRHEDQTARVLDEIRTDIKTLLTRHS